MGTLSEQWLLPAVIVGLVVATVLMAGLVRRHQQLQADRQMAARRLAQGARGISELLTELAEVPLPEGLGELLRRDVLERYQRIVRLDRRFPDLNRLLLEAGAQLKSVPAGGGPVPVLADENRTAIAVKALDGLTGIVEGAGLLRPPAIDDRRRLGVALRERRAEVLSAFYSARARELWPQSPLRGRAQVASLLSVLRERGPATARVRELHEQAIALLAELDGAAAAGG